MVDRRAKNANVSALGLAGSFFNEAAQSGNTHEHISQRFSQSIALALCVALGRTMQKRKACNTHTLHRNARAYSKVLSDVRRSLIICFDIVPSMPVMLSSALAEFNDFATDVTCGKFTSRYFMGMLINFRFRDDKNKTLKRNPDSIVHVVGRAPRRTGKPFVNHATRSQNVKPMALVTNSNSPELIA